MFLVLQVICSQLLQFQFLYSLSMSVWTEKLVTTCALTLIIFNQCPGCISYCFLLNFPCIFLMLRPYVMSQSNPRQNGFNFSSLTNKTSKFSEPNFLLMYPELLVPTAPWALKGGTAQPHPSCWHLHFTGWQIIGCDTSVWKIQIKNKRFVICAV